MFFNRRGKVISLTDEGEALGTAAAEMLSEMLEALKEQAAEDGTSPALPSVITNSYATMLPLSDDELHDDRRSSRGAQKVRGVAGCEG
ncbi:MAG: hypothetical protein ACI36W_04270 [Coriobacteriales bacterium]